MPEALDMCRAKIAKQHQIALHRSSGTLYRGYRPKRKLDSCMMKLVTFCCVTLVMCLYSASANPILQLLEKSDYVGVFRLLGIPDTTVEMGNLRGIQQGAVNIFYSVPYAQPPIGDLRFRKPVPHPGWTGIRNATEPGYGCMQSESTTDPFSGEMSEDCLTLNIFVPRNTNLTQLPVIVFVHGGSLLYGSSLIYDARFLAGYAEAIVVSMNYRLGFFGFLSSGDGKIKGNFGLYDQQLAMRWVKDNIANFGGNPNEITLIGHSAGGSSVVAQMLSPLNNNSLFQRVVSLSSDNKPSAMPLSTRREVYRSLLEMSSCNGTADEVECLRSVSAKEIVNITGRMLEGWFFGTYVDIMYEEEFLPGKPEDFFDWATNLHDYKVVIGLVELESSIYSGLVEFNQTIADVVPEIFQYYQLPQATLEQITKLMEFNYKVYDVADKNIATALEMLEVISDRYFNIPSVEFASLLAQANISTYFFRLVHPVYQSLFLPRPDYLGGKTLHDDSVSYLFGASSMASTQGEDTQVSLNLIGALRSLIHTGQVVLPDPGVTWNMYDPKVMNTLKIGLNYTNQQHFFARSLDLWTNMVPYVISNRCDDVTDTEEGCVDKQEYDAWKERYQTWLGDYLNWKAEFQKYKKMADEGKACRRGGRR